MRWFKQLSRKKKTILLAILSVLLIVAWWFIATFMLQTTTVSESTQQEITEQNTEDVLANEQPKEESTEEPEQAVPIEEPATETQQWPVLLTNEQANSITVVVNKKHKLPSSYVPQLTTVNGGQVRPEIAQSLQNMMNAAQNAGTPAVIISSYRSYQTQASTYQYWVDLQGQAEADRSSARPGHSEHQTGLTIDFGNPDGSCRLLACFGDGAAGKWLASNAHKYGFIIRYPQGKESLTGYIYEPWHLRYVGEDIATSLYNSGQTLDQYFNIPAGDYL